MITFHFKAVAKKVKKKKKIKPLTCKRFESGGK